MNKYGFKLDDFPGNMTVVMALVKKEKLIASGLCPSDYSLNDQQPEWVVISPTGSYDPEYLSELAEKISKQLDSKSIRFDFGDASGFLGFCFYDKGELIHSYSFGPDYSEEMEEYGKVRKAQENETLIRDGVYEYSYYSKIEHPDEVLIRGGEKFLNQQFVDQKAILSWDYLPG